jgi:HTH-type transcriptional regulator/antitoxin HipB
MTAKTISSPQLSVYGKVSTSKEIGRLIAHKRKDIGMKQEIAAGLSGVGTKFLSQLENGKETAEIGKVIQVLNRLGLELYVFPRSANPLRGE